MKCQLVYPEEFDWKLSFATLIKNARYDSETEKVTINIPDPNLYLEIENFIDEQGAYIERHLNSKILQMRTEYFIDLIVATEPEKEKKVIIKEMRKLFKKEAKDNSAFDENNIGKSLINTTIKTVNILESIVNVVSSGNVIYKALSVLLKLNATKG